MPSPSLFPSLKRFRAPSALAQNTAWILGGRGVRLALQAIYFIFIARGLGTREYGAFVGAVSLISLLAAFSGWGFGWMLVEEVSRDRARFSHAWGNAILMTVLSAAILLSLVLLMAHFVLGHSFAMAVLALVGLSDLVFVRFVDMSAQAFQAVEVLQKAAQVDVVLGAARTLAAVLFIAFGKNTTAFSWSELYLASSALAGIYSLMLVSRKIGSPRFHFSLSGKRLRDGFYYAISTASQTAYNDIDKTMLVTMVGLEATGIYGAAYRIIDVVFAPISSLVYASSARFFRHGISGISTCTQYAKKLVPYVALYAVIAIGGLVLCSPLIPIILGKNFAASAEAVRWLSPIILFRGMHYLFSNALTGSGLQRLRSIIQIAVAGLNILLNLWLIPKYSWRGAAYASLVSDGLLVLLFWYATQNMIAKMTAIPPPEGIPELNADSR